MVDDRFARHRGMPQLLPMLGGDIQLSELFAKPHALVINKVIDACTRVTVRKLDRPACRLASRLTDRQQTDRQTDKQTDGQIDR